jgi:hypothetical protein
MENEIRINIDTNNNLYCSSDESTPSTPSYNDNLEDTLNIHIYDDLVDSEPPVLIASDYLDKIQLYDYYKENKENKKNNWWYLLCLPIIVVVIPLFSIYRYIF